MSPSPSPLMVARLPAVRAEAVPSIAALDLLRGGDVVRIVLGDQVYTLRLTRAGKLILTK